MLVPENGFLPVAIWYITAPSENMSLRAIELLAAGLLRRHVNRGTEDLSRNGQVFLRLAVAAIHRARHLGQTEVENLDLPELVRKMLAGLMSR